jgi:hypothetical protein
LILLRYRYRHRPVTIDTLRYRPLPYFIQRYTSLRIVTYRYLTLPIVTSRYRYRYPNRYRYRYLTVTDRYQSIFYCIFVFTSYYSETISEKIDHS